MKIMEFEICLLVYVALILLLLVFRRKPTHPLLKGLVGWWVPRDGVLRDISGNQNHGQLVNLNQWHHFSYVFDGTDDFVYLNGNPYHKK